MLNERTNEGTKGPVGVCGQGRTYPPVGSLGGPDLLLPQGTGEIRESWAES